MRICDVHGFPLGNFSEGCPYCEIDRLKAQLARYAGGVEVTGVIGFSELLQQSVIYIDEDSAYPANMEGQPVTVLVMKKG